MGFIDALIHWQEDYCIGSRMPRSFREFCSKGFEQMFQNPNPDLKNIKLNDGTIIYRAINIDDFLYYSKKFQLDSLYYSFSKSLNGLYSFCSLEKYLKRGGFILLVSKSNSALDYNELMDHCYSNFQSRYSDEEEVVSKLEKADLLNIYFVKELSDLLDYKNKGIILNFQDINSKKKLKQLIKRK